MNHINQKESGIVFLELALIFPVFVVIIFCSIEVSRYLTLKQANAGVSYQLANAIYRECIDPFDNDVTNQCIDAQVARFREIILALIPAGEFRRATEFRTSVAAFSSDGSCQLVRSPEGDNSVAASRIFEPGSGCFFRNNFSPAVDRGPLVGVEVFTPYQPLVGGFVLSLIPGLGDLIVYSVSVV